MEIIYIKRKPKSVDGKGWIFLQEFWKLIVFYLLEKEINLNRLLKGKRFYKSKKEEFEKLYKVLKESKGFNLDEKIVEELRKLDTPIAQELLENSVYHLYKLLDTIPITEVDRPQDIGSVLIERRWNKWESSIHDISRYPPAPDVKNKFSPTYWKKYFNDLDQKLTNFFFENLTINYEALISKEDANKLRKKAILGYLEKLRGLIIDHPKWVFKSTHSSGTVEKLASVDLEELWTDFSDIILTSSIGDYEENIPIILGKYLQKKNILISTQVISETMNWPHYQFSEHYLGWVKDQRIDSIFLETVPRTLMNFSVNAKEEIRNFLNRLQEKEKKWMVVIPVEGFQFPGDTINFKYLFLKFINSIDFLNGKIEARFIDILRNYEEFIVIDQVSGTEPNMARYIACKKVRRVLDLLSFVLDSPLVIDPNPLSCVISKEGGSKTGGTFLLDGDIPKLECWKRPINVNMILLERDKLIIYSGNENKKNEKKIRRALRWLNKSLSETENEVKFLELWIPFELLGGGSCHYKDNIPKILAEKYISRRWSSLTIKQRDQTIYREREQAGKIVDFLGKIRNSLLIHGGEIDLPQLNYSVEQLHSIMRFLIKEIFEYLDYKFNKKETVSDLTKEMIARIDRIRGLRS